MSFHPFFAHALKDTIDIDFFLHFYEESQSSTKIEVINLFWVIARTCTMTQDLLHSPFNEMMLDIFEIDEDISYQCIQTIVYEELTNMMKSQQFDRELAEMLNDKLENAIENGTSEMQTIATKIMTDLFSPKEEESS